MPTITGFALASPLRSRQRRSAFNDGFMELQWDEIVDFRTGIRTGFMKALVSGAQRGNVAHGPFKLGNGAYWIVAYCQPTATLDRL